MSIKVVVFDCGGVLLRDGDLTPYRVWEERLGLEEGALAKLLWTGPIWIGAERGQLTDGEFWRRAGEEIGVCEPDRIASLRQEIWNTWVLDEQVMELVDSVRQRYRVAILSNATDALEDLLATRYGVADRFEVIVNSARVGTAKPEEEIFRILLHKLQVQPQEVVFIDDRAENVTAAASLGMHVIWFVDAAELRRQLRCYLNGHDNGPARG